MHRFTIKELEQDSDYEILAQLVRDSQERVSNYYTPFKARLGNLLEKLKDGSKLSKTRKPRQRP